MVLAPIQFDFVFADIRFACRCEDGPSDGDGEAQLKVVGDAGALPFTAESPGGRAALAAIIAAGNDHLGPVFKVTQGRKLVGTECDLRRPVTATGLMSTVVAFVLPTRPYLDLIAEVVRPPMQAAKPGENPLRPAWRRPLKARGR